MSKNIYIYCIYIILYFYSSWIWDFFFKVERCYKKKNKKQKLKSKDIFTYLHQKQINK